MFKKKQLVTESETVKAPKKKAAASKLGKRLMSWLYQPLVVIVAGFAVLGLLLELLFIQPSETASLDQLNKTILSSAQYQIDTYIKQKRQGIKSLAAKSEAEIESHIALSDIWSDLQALYLVETGGLETVKVRYPEMSFASIDLLRRADKSGKPVIEAFFNQKQWYFQIVVPQPQEQKVEGQNAQMVLAVFNLKRLKQLLKFSPVAQNGSLSLMTSQGRRVIAFGSGVDGVSVSVHTAVPQWQLEFSPAPSVVPVADRIIVIALLSATAVILLVLVLILVRSNIAKVRKDIQYTSQYISKRVTTGKANKNFVHAEFVSMVDAVCTQLEEFVERNKAKASQKSESEADKQSQEGSVESVADAVDAPVEDDDAPLFDDDLLDLDSLDEDLSANSEAIVSEVKELSGEISQTIFRAYDIRGIVDDTLNPEVVELIGKAIATEAIAQGQNKLCVGFDGRLSSIDYCQALSRGIVSTGVDVIIIGQVPTPLLYFSTHHYGTGSGVMITGSHNPGNYNGFKIMLAGKALSGDEIQKLYNRIVIQDFAQGDPGSISEESVTQDYMDTILNDIAVAAPLKVVVDAGNGVAGAIAPELIEELGCEVIPLHCEVDGTFPNHHPDPGKPENLQDLINAVQEHDADLGLAFDGDGDRVGVVTNTGKIIWPDRLLMLFAKDVVSRNPGADVLFDVKCSRRLNGLISSYGGRPIMWKTGHSLVKAKMAETGALLAGEMSGHIFFKERWFGFDDGIYSAVRLLEVLGVEDRSSDEVFADFPEDVSTPEINITVTDETKFQLVEKLCLLKGQFEGGNVSTIDGLRVDYPNGWGLCRASNTTPVLVLRFEADDETSLEEIKEKFKAQLSAVDPALDLNF